MRLSVAVQKVLMFRTLHLPRVVLAPSWAGGQSWGRALLMQTCRSAGIHSAYVILQGDLDSFFERMFEFVDRHVNVESAHEPCRNAIHLRLLDVCVEAMNILKRCVIIDCKTILSKPDKFALGLFTVSGS